MDAAATPGPYAAIVLAGGTGSRAALGQPKQRAALNGKPLLCWSLNVFAADPRCTALVLVASADDAALAAVHGYQPTIAAPGAERQASVRSGLAALAALPDDALVLVHDSARPALPLAVIDRLLAALEGGAPAAIPVLAHSDTLVRITGAGITDGLAGAVIPRDQVAAVQTPQAFRLGVLRRAHAAATDTGAATDDAQMVRALGEAVTLVAGDAALHKVTWADDLARVAAHLPSNRDNDTMADTSAHPPLCISATGFDVHRLVAGESLWLAGVNIPHSHGLSGHSDADAALHALTDAILGLTGDGDIGQHFPPSDPQWRGAASAQFLAHALTRLAERGGRLVHADLTIMAEAPKIGPHRDKMRARLAELLALPLHRISVKATTTEGLGLTGRREGIAVLATATAQVEG